VLTTALPLRPGAGPRRVLVAVRSTPAIGRVVARLAERADVEIAVATPCPGLHAADLLGIHENVTTIDRARFVAALASSHLLIADAPAARGAAAALGVPTVEAGGAPAGVLQHAERLLDGGEAPPISLAA
jgi:hypothetical protein